MALPKNTYKVLKLDQIKPNPANPRDITEEDRETLRNKLETYGNVGVIVVDKNYTILSGHQRYSILKEMGEEEVMCVIGEHLTQAQADALMIDLNSSLGTGSWNKEKLNALYIKLKQRDDFDPIEFEATKLNQLETTELSQFRDLQSFAESYNPVQEGEQPSASNVSTSPSYQYTIVFRDEAEMNTFYSWLHELRAKYPDCQTMSERIILELVGDERNAVN